MNPVLTMRDRRSTSLSVSSASSSTSTTSSSEKRYPTPPSPLSPTLPAPVTEKSHNRARRRLLLRSTAYRLLLAIGTTIFLWRCFVTSLSVNLTFNEGNRPPPVDNSTDTEWVGADTLPDEPTALLVSNPDGHARWTVSIPSGLPFPLRDRQYRTLCEQAETLQAGLERGRSLAESPVTGWRRKPSYVDPDPSFLDIAEAEGIGALPPQSDTRKEDANAVCDTSLTFAMDTDDASFGKTLLLLWLSYGLARKEGRAFFIDDTRWPYGTYTSYFSPPPTPSCSPPPAHHIVPCPHAARHLLVSAATAPWTFDAAFEQTYHRPRKHDHRRDRDATFDLVRAGYEALFHLVSDDATYAADRIAMMKRAAAPTVGMHIRRGDLHPSEYQFSRDYLPLDRYATSARSLSQALRQNHHNNNTSTSTDIPATLLLASDDPDILTSPDLTQAALPASVHRAQDRILLATKAALDRTAPVVPLREPGSAYVKHLEENSGWEGGFYRALFYSLDGGGGGDGEDGVVSPQALRMRELVGRAYVLDLAVLGASDGVVCAVGSAACRVLGVTLGREAVREGRWVNVDDGRRGWSWDGRR